jgi:AAHS family 4-hydroxybenzoate transporter-like MFS transporter
VSSPADPQTSSPGRSNDEGFDIRANIDSAGWSGLAKRAVALAALVVLLDGFDIQVLGFSIGLMARDFGVDKGAFSWVLALSYIGIGVGAATGGLVGDRIGRKSVLLIAVNLFGVFTALTALAQSLAVVTFCRIVAGIGLGMVLPAVAALIAELTPIRRRGFAIALATSCLPIGAMLGGVAAAAILPSMGWRALFVLGGAAPIVLGVVLWFALPESPRFQAARGTERDRTRAIATLHRMGQQVGPATVLTRLDGDVGRASAKVLVGAEYRRDTVGLCIAFFFSMLGTYAFLSWGPTLLVAAGFTVAAASLGVSVFHFGGIICAVLGGWLMVRRGSRIVLTAYALGVAVAGIWLFLIEPSADNSVALVYAQLFLYGGTVSGLQVLLYSLAAQIYPVTVKATGVGVAGMVGRAGAIVAAFLGASLVAAGEGWYYAMVVMVGVLVAVAMILVKKHSPRAARSPRLEPAAV